MGGALYYKDNVADRLYGIGTVQRIYLVQAWFNVSDEGVVDVIYDNYALRKFAGIGFMTEQVPDETTLLHFQASAGRKPAWVCCIKRLMDETGHIMHSRTIVDVTIINMPSSTKNAALA